MGREGKRLLSETLEEVKRHGLEQEELRGLNFVRLEKDGNSCIAVIEMKSVSGIE